MTPIIRGMVPALDSTTSRRPACPHESEDLEFRRRLHCEIAAEIQHRGWSDEEVRRRTGVFFNRQRRAELLRARIARVDATVWGEGRLVRMARALGIEVRIRREIVRPRDREATLRAT